MRYLSNNKRGKERHRRFLASAAVVVSVVSLSLPVPADAQFAIFGRNKVQYDNFNWKLLNTAHFTIHHYEGAEAAAVDAARIAERAYDYLSQILQVRLEEKVPVLLYADHQDFRQTNAVSGITEGVQGVTESFKRRIILPMMPTMEGYIHVFTHELVHRFQLEMMGAGNSLNPMQWMPPLWVMEGMAEYLTIGMDPNTRIWLRDIVQRDEFITLTEFETVMDQRVYRLGQGLYHFLGERYGVESIRLFFRETIRTRSWQEAINRVYSKNPKELSDEWQAFMKAEHSDIVAGQDEVESIATRLIEHEGMVYNLNLTPVLSPDGDRIAYIANENLRDAVYVANSETGKSRRALAHGGKSGALEMIDFFESTMSWTDDGEILAFVSSGGAEDVIHLVDSRTGRTQKKLRYEGMSIVSAALSPDGSQVAFSGMIDGTRDLYVASTSGGEPRRITSDVFSYLHPSWSPDASRIAVATDRGSPTDAGNLDFRGFRLALVDPATGDVELLTGGAYHDINPVWSPDGGTLAFVTDRAGVPQIFLYDLENRNIRKITNLVTGVSGITSSSPAISWSRTGKMAFSSYREMGWDIYTMPNPLMNPAADVDQVVEPDTKPFEPLWAGYQLANTATFRNEEYSTRLKTDYVFGGGAFATNVGLIGDVFVGMSDMLGNHQVFLQLGLMGSLSRSNLIAAYINMKSRLNWGFTAYQMATSLGGYYTSFYTSEYLSMVYRGLSWDTYYPLNTFSRLEGSVGYIGLQYDMVEANYYGRTRVIEKLDRISWGEVSVGHVYDSAFYFVSGPIGGMRWRAEAHQTVGARDANTNVNQDATTLTLDFRKYVTLNHRGAIAFRTLTGNMLTNGELGSSIRRFQIGGPTMLHGTAYGQMAGTNFLIQNVEMRYPLLPWLPIQWDFLTGALFADVGAVWNKGYSNYYTEPENLDSPVWVYDFDNNVYLENRIVGAVGAGIRANMMGLTLFFDYSLPTDFKGNWGEGRLQFAIGQIF